MSSENQIEPKDGLYKKIENNGKTIVFELYNKDFSKLCYEYKKDFLAMVVKRTLISSGKFLFDGITNNPNSGLCVLSHQDAEKRWLECEKEYNRSQPMVDVNKEQTPTVKSKNIILSLYNFILNRIK